MRKRSKRKPKRATYVCKVRSFAKITHVSARLSRAGRTIAVGSADHGRLRLTGPKALRHGRYTLTLVVRHTHRRWRAVTHVRL